ncbi:MAG: tetratricopeptide repeat protein [Acidiferrobacterales bacterium]
MIASIVAASTLAGCAGAPGQSQHPGQKSSAKTVTTSPEPSLPRVELTPEVLYDVLVGELAGRKGDFEVSVHSLSRAARLTHDPRLAERATRAAIYSKRYAEALDVARLWVELRPAAIDARVSLATILLELENPVEAERQFEQMLTLAEKQKKLDQIYLRIAAVLARHKNRTTSLEIMQQLSRQHAGSAQAQFALAHLGLRAGNSSIASAAIDRALIIQPGWQEAALLKARILSASKDQKKARRFYQQFLKQYPEAAKVRMNYARNLVDRQQWEEARNQFVRVLRQRPKDTDVLYALGLLSLQTDRLEDANKYFQLAIEINPSNDQIRMYLGQTAERRKRYDEAEQWYLPISSKKLRLEARVRLAVVVAKRGDLEKGLRTLRSLIPVSDEQRVMLALAEEQILRDAKQYNAALAVLTRALKALPKHKDLLYARALVAEKLDNIALHERDLRLVLKLDPKNAHALNALGYTLADRTDRHQEALALIKQALELRPNDPFILDSMGWVHYRLGNSDDAVRFLRRALDIRADAEISAHLGEVLWTSGKQRQATRVWERALEKNPDNEVLNNAIKKFRK